MMNLLQLTHSKLHSWYKEHGRKSLPWRNTADPYAIYISEVMLQQTQVQTVLERYYFPFLSRFPSLAALAAAEQEEVLKAWQGLGYYSRAVNLHKAAKIAAPSLPSDIPGLLALPGIGKNTAHAVAAFGYHLPVPVMEANVKRLIYRIFALKEGTEPLLWEKACALLDKANPFDYNQAVMDIGSLVCTRTRPSCNICPFNDICQGKDAPELYPAKKAKKQVPVIRKHIIAFQDANSRYHVTARTTRFLHGLYGFNEYNKEHGIVFQESAYTLDAMEYIGAITQSYSHFTLEADIYRQVLPVKANGPAWQMLEEIGKLPLSRADSKVLKLLGGS